MRTQAAADPSISPQVTSQLSGLTIDLGTSKAFEEQTAGISMTAGEREALGG